MESILSTWGRVLRFIIILVVIILVSTQIVKRFLNDSEVISQSILAASDCWEKTGIIIKPGESYKIKVTGKIHTAGDYLFRDVSNDTIPNFQWCGPEGREFRIRTDSSFQKYDV